MRRPCTEARLYKLLHNRSFRCILHAGAPTGDDSLEQFAAFQHLSEEVRKILRDAGAQWPAPGAHPQAEGSTSNTASNADATDLYGAPASPQSSAYSASSFDYSDACQNSSSGRGESRGGSPASSIFDFRRPPVSVGLGGDCVPVWEPPVHSFSATASDRSALLEFKGYLPLGCTAPSLYVIHGGTLVDISDSGLRVEVGNRACRTEGTVMNRAWAFMVINIPWIVVHEDFVSARYAHDGSDVIKHLRV